ncbi:hypothetical protein PFISCL1PPCAC_9951, partial [Pristionchus fissidentatus]
FSHSVLSLLSSEEGRLSLSRQSQKMSRNHQRMIVSEKEVRKQLTDLLYKRLNAIRDTVHLDKIMAELQIDFDKSLPFGVTLASLIPSIESRDPDRHFEYDPRDGCVHFVKNKSSSVTERRGNGEGEMAALSLSSPPIASSSSSMPRHVQIPLAVIDMINENLRNAKFKKFSVDRIHANVINEMRVDVEREQLMAFIESHIATGEIHAKIENPLCPILSLKEDEEEWRLSDSSARSAANTARWVEETRSIASRRGEEENRKKKEEMRRREEGRDDRSEGRRDPMDDRREERGDGREDRQDDRRENRRDDRRGDERSEGRRDQREDRREERRGDDRYERREEERRGPPTAAEIQSSFRSIDRLGELIYLLQTVDKDVHGRDIEWKEFMYHLDDIVGGTLNYSLFGLSQFPELIYHRLIDSVGNRRVHISPLVAEARVIMLREYLAVEMYEILKKKKRATLEEITEEITSINAAVLYDEKPDWGSMDDDLRVGEVRAMYKTYTEVFVMWNNDIYIEKEFTGFVVYSFRFLNF